MNDYLLVFIIFPAHYIITNGQQLLKETRGIQGGWGTWGAQYRGGAANSFEGMSLKSALISTSSHTPTKETPSSWALTLPLHPTNCTEPHYANYPDYFFFPLLTSIFPCDIPSKEDKTPFWIQVLQQLTRRATSFFSLHTNLIPGLNDQPQKQGWRFSALFSLRSFESTSVSLKNTFTAALQTHSEPRIPLIAFCAGLGWRCISQASLVTSALTHITAQVSQRSSSFASLGQTRFIWISAVLPVFSYLPHRRIIAD